MVKLNDACCLYDQKKTCSNTNSAHGAGSPFTGWCKALKGNSYCYHGHDRQAHDAHDQKDQYQTRAAAAALNSEVQPMFPGRNSIVRCCFALEGDFPATGKLVQLPVGELEHAYYKYDYSCHNRYDQGQQPVLH